MARAAIKIEFSEESLAAIRDLAERLERVADQVAKIDTRDVGKVIGREINRAATTAKRARR